MKTILKIISLLGLLLTFFPSIFVLMGKITMGNHFTLMAVGMILWFASAPFWIESKSIDEE